MATRAEELAPNDVGSGSGFVDWVTTHRWLAIAILAGTAALLFIVVRKVTSSSQQSSGTAGQNTNIYGTQTQLQLPADLAGEGAVWLLEQQYADQGGGGGGYNLPAPNPTLAPPQAPPDTGQVNQQTFSTSSMDNATGGQTTPAAPATTTTSSGASLSQAHSVNFAPPPPSPSPAVFAGASRPGVF